MARAPIEIGIASETKAFKQGIESGVIDPVEDAEKALKKLGDTDAGEDIDRDLDKAQKATKRLASETKDAADQIEDAFRQSYRKARQDSDDTTRKMASGFDEAADEAKQSAREGAASFSGEFDDVADFIQETLANALGGFGPIGAAAGLAAAVGLGIAVAKVTEMQDKVEELQQVANDLHMDSLAEGLSVEQFVTSIEGATASLERMNEAGQKKFRYFWEEDDTGLQEFVKDLKRTGEVTADATDVLQLATPEMEKYRDSVSASSAELRRQADAIKDTERGMGTLSSADRERIDSLREQADAGDRVVESLNSEIETRSEAAERSNAWNESGAAAATARAEAEKTAAEDRVAAEEEAAARIQGAVDAVRESQASAYDSMRDKAYEKATADNAAFDLDKWLSYVEETRAAADAYRANLGTMQLTPDEWSNLLALPEDARVTIAASYAAAGDDGKARIREALGDGGASDAGAAATTGFSEAFKPEANVEVTAETDAAGAKIEETSKDRDTKITVSVDGVDGARSALDGLAVTRTVVLKVDDWAVRNWRAPLLQATVRATPEAGYKWP